MSNNSHGRPRDEQPLTPDDVATPSHAERARTLVGQQRTGSLATISQASSPCGAGYPYSSYTTFALNGSDPVFLISRMATHTHHLQEDTKASLLVHEHGATDPLANGRVTLVGPCKRLDDANATSAARAAFLAAHPQSEYYVDFSDFGFWQLQVEAIRYIGGYGRMSWVDAEAWRAAEADPLAAHAAGIIQHMNDDHAEALIHYAEAFTRAQHSQEVHMTGIDRYGFELSVLTDRGHRPARIAFHEQVHHSEAARKALIERLHEAREKNA